MRTSLAALAAVGCFLLSGCAFVSLSIHHAAADNAGQQACYTFRRMVTEVNAGKVSTHAQLMPPIAKMEKWASKTNYKPVRVGAERVALEFLTSEGGQAGASAALRHMQAICHTALGD